MFGLIVTLDVREERIPEFLDAIRTNSHASLSGEEGCLRFDVHRSATVANRFHLYELYRDRAAFEVEHRSAPHYTAWRRAVDEYVVPGTHHHLELVPPFPADIPESLI